jgi:hypothetical protein
MWRSDSILRVRFWLRKQELCYEDTKPQIREMGSQESAP